MAELAPKRIVPERPSNKPVAADDDLCQLNISLELQFLKRIEDYRFAQRHKSMSAATRELIELGLRASGGPRLKI